ncbi:MAG: Nucleoside diphosphate kinase [Chlamydiae bacterium]|nr:Nucleoside diphosphate kinase [Chlamydiota bacterium]
MTLEQTLSIIKPDAVGDNHIGEILTRYEKAGLKIIASKMLHLTTDQAKAFYIVHAHRPFFEELVSLMTSGPVLVLVLEGESAIAKNRELMGATDPKEAAPGTIRADFAKTIDKNAVHGSDSTETAKQEIPFFFKSQEIYSR